MTKKPFDKKRFLHILHVIYDILATAFLVVISGALIYNAVTKNNDQLKCNSPKVQVVERKSRDNYYMKDGYSYIGCADFGSYQYYLAQKDLWTGQENICQTGVSYEDWILGQSITIDYIDFFDLYIGEFSNNGDFSFRSVYQIDIIKFELDTSFDDHDEFNIIFSSTEYRSRWMLSSTFYYSDINHAYMCADFATFFSYDNGAWEVYDYSRTGFRFSPSDFSGIIPSTESFETSIPQAIQQYYYDMGYATGHRVGYDEGLIDGNNGIDNNAFTIIGQAFQAVSYIFDINVLPGLPLWVLVFTPLIISVVIVVVKMIKG